MPALDLTQALSMYYYDLYNLDFLIYNSYAPIKLECLPLASVSIIF
jgi:hypothetical protein